MKVKVSSLKHHPKNKEIYTLSSIEELMESISEVGLLQSLIIDQHSQIISGNRRFESIKRLGWKEVNIEVPETLFESFTGQSTLKICQTLCKDFRLTHAPKELVYLKRKHFKEIPPKVEYSLTKKSENLCSVFKSIEDWSNKNYSL